MILYGIKTCTSVRKAVKFFKDNNIEFEFIDFKKEPVGKNKIEKWLSKTTIEKLFNSRGTKYRLLKLKELNLDKNGKKEWLAKENLIIKRPVIEYKDEIVVGFDEDEYKKVFL